MKRWLSKTIARWVKRAPLSAPQLLVLNPKRILLVRQQNQMGDMVCATPAFRAIRENFPLAEIVLVTSPVNREVVQNNPHLDGVFTFRQKMWRNPFELFPFLAQLRSFNPEVSFVLSSVSFSVTSAALAFISGAQYVVGADSKPFGLDISDQAFSLIMPSEPTLNRHSVLHSLAPLKAIGISTQDLTTVVVPSAKEKQEAERILIDLDLASGFWAIHPGAGKMQNVWPAEFFAQIARKATSAGHRIMILHGPADAGPLNELTTFLAEDIPESVKVAPACSIGVGAAILQEANRFLCNDTGVMHMAGALPVPTLALFGPTSPELWKPPVAEVVALCSPEQTPDSRGSEYGWMENLNPADVWATWCNLPVRTD